MKKTHSLMNNWTFTYGKDGSVQTLDLPHSWNAADGQDGGGDYWRGTCTYETAFDAPVAGANEDVYLEFDGVSASATVEVNGRTAGSHDGGYSRFRYCVTDLLVPGKNALKVTVDNSANDHVYPQNADFTFYGGIYRSVRLVVVSKTRFDMDTFGGCGVKVTPVLNADGTASVRVESKVTGGDVRIRIYEGAVSCLDPAPFDAADRREGPQAAMGYLPAADAPRPLTAGSDVASLQTAVAEGEGCDVTITIAQPHLWNGRKDPFLYTAVAELYDGDTKTDEIAVRFGIRSFVIDVNEGFFLNGESYPLHGVAMHQDWLGKGNAITKADMKTSVMHVYDMGATTIRLAHYQHDQYTYDLCDELGLVLWTEIPYISEHLDNARDNGRSQMKELITQNISHPSIAVWGISNEITMAHGDNPNLVPFHQELNQLIHQMDPTRPSTMACISMLPVDHDLLSVPDVLSYNHYFGWYGGHLEDNGPWFDRFHELHPTIPVGMSEYGCENSLWHSAHPEPGDYTNEYQMRYHESMIKQLFARKYMWATHVWNMFDFAADARDEGGTHGRNNKGLVTFDRAYRKDVWYAYQAWLTEEPMIHLCSKEYVNRDGDETEFVVYSNQPEVTLYVNGEPKTLAAEDHFFHFAVKQPEGEYTVRAEAGSLFEEQNFCHVNEADPAYSFEKGVVLNWFDIETPEGYFNIKCLMRDIMKTPEGLHLMMSFLTQLNTRREAMWKAIEEKEGKPRVKPGAGMSQEEQMAHMVAFSPLQMIRMSALDLTKEQIIDMNRRLNQIRIPEE